MRSRIRTIILIVAVLALLSFVEGLHGSASANTPQATAAKAWTFSGKGTGSSARSVYGTRRHSAGGRAVAGS